MTPPNLLAGPKLSAVPFNNKDVDEFYRGFANATLWPAYHDAIAEPVLDPKFWDRYRIVNQRFARAAAVSAPIGSAVWIHDYHLQLVPLLLRTLRPDLRIGFFLHVPFPAPETFMRLPWRAHLVAGMLGADLVGFQTDNDAANFRSVAGRLGGRIARKSAQVRVGAYPVGIDAEGIEGLGRRPETDRRARELRAALGHPKTVLLGVDRLDYTKGIPARLRAYRDLLDDGRLDAASTSLVQIAEPTRDRTPGYEDVRAEVERLVGEINGEHGSFGAPAVTYVHHSQTLQELVALYRTADVMLVTPYRDGMNLVAKEYVAARAGLPGGSLVLSEFAGASHQLVEARQVNPFDIESLKNQIHAATTQGSAPGAMDAMARGVHQHDVRWWASSFLAALDESVGNP